MIRYAAYAIAFAAAAGPAFAHDDIAYVGVWDCGIGTFTFTAESYNPGDSVLAIRAVEVDGGSYLLSFDDGYQIALSDVTDTTMSWLSLASGDGFDCSRLHR